MRPPLVVGGGWVALMKGRCGWPPRTHEPCEKTKTQVKTEITLKPHSLGDPRAPAGVRVWWLTHARFGDNLLASHTV
jgi:hypothetical protein